MSDELIAPGALIAARTAWGTLLLAAPEAVLRRCGDPPGHQVRLGARLLGARHLAEAAMQRRHRSALWHRLFRAADLGHGATMAVLATRAPRYRVPALVSLAISIALGMLD